jgi:type III secretion system chaperone SycN
MNLIIQELCRDLGINSISFEREGELQFSILNYGALTLKKLPDQLLIFLSREYSFLSDAICQQALTLCHHRENPPFCINVGLQKGSRIIFSLCIPESEVALPTIDQAIKLLNNFQNRLTSTAGTL